MAYHFEKNGEDNDLVIDGFEKGIADSPELGIADIRSANITSVPGEASVSFATSAGSIPPTGLSAVAYTATASNDTITVAATTSYYNGMAIKIGTVSTTPAINALIVAGGGGGGFNNGTAAAGAGGGAGDVEVLSAVSLTAATYPVVVGNPGLGSTNVVVGTNGGTSSFNGTSATGGGAGAVILSSGNTNGASGGSGGGATSSGTGGSATGSNANAGANGPGGTGGGSGGGGASAPGSVATTGANGNGGNGGMGYTSSITGSSIVYADGGGGAGASGGSGTNGTGGSGNGGTGNKAGTGGTAVANTGSGGGGGTTAGGSGAAGVVIISYPTGVYTATGGSITTSGGNTIHTFNSNGNFVISAVNIKVGDVYYVGNLTSTTFKLYYDPTVSNLVNIIADVTGNYAVQALGTPVFSTTYGLNSALASSYDNLMFMIDNTGNAWFIPTITQILTGGTVTAGSAQWCGNASHSSSGSSADFGIITWNAYLLVMIGTHIDYISIANLFTGATPVSSKWVYGWKTNLNQTSYQHMALAATDGNVYICNGAAVASLVIQSSAIPFDPTSTSSYTWNVAAIPLPATDVAVSIGQISAVNTILIGGSKNIVYVFDSTNPGGGIATELTCADSYISRIVGTNSTAYVFAGQRGRIYITGGGTLQLYKKIPDNLSGNPEPYYTWQDAQYFRNKIYFTFTATDNSGASLSTVGGIWTLGIDNGQTAIQLPTAGSLYNCNQFSYGTYGGSCPCLFTIPYSQFLGSNPPGYGVGGVWVNSSIVGIDVPTSSPYTGAQCYIDSDIIPVGTYGKLRSYRNFEYKLAKPLVAGESVTAYMRSDLSGSFTQFFSSTSAAVSDMTSKLNFEKVQWIQFRVSLASTATAPSYNRLTQIRIR